VAYEAVVVAEATTIKGTQNTSPPRMHHYVDLTTNPQLLFVHTERHANYKMLCTKSLVLEMLPNISMNFITATWLV